MSNTTVSMVLNGRGKEFGISDAVIKKVQELAKELNYKPNRLARSLRTGSTKVLGVIVLDLANKFHAKLSRAIEDCAAEHGFRVMVCSSDETDTKFAEWVDELVDYKVEGIIIAPTVFAKKKILELKRSKYPFVLVDRTFSGIETDFVGIDNFKASYDAISHMIAKGYRKMGIIAFQPDMVNMKERISGYRQALKDNNIRIDNRLVKTISYDHIEEQVIKHTHDLVVKENARAILFTSNRIGIIGLQKLYNMKMRIPQDIAVINYDDTECFPMMHPAITAIAQPIEMIGKIAVELVLSRLKGREGFEKIHLEANLIIRNSC